MDGCSLMSRELSERYADRPTFGKTEACRVTLPGLRDPIPPCSSSMSRYDLDQGSIAIYRGREEHELSEKSPVDELHKRNRQRFLKIRRCKDTPSTMSSGRQCCISHEFELRENRAERQESKVDKSLRARIHDRNKESISSWCSQTGRRHAWKNGVA